MMYPVKILLRDYELISQKLTSFQEWGYNDCGCCRTPNGPSEAGWRRRDPPTRWRRTLYRGLEEGI